MILSWDELPAQRGVVAMVDGGFDPLHPGHIDYFEAAHGLGHPVLCNISSDVYVARKHPLLLTQAQRARIIDAVRFVDFTHLSQVTTAEVLEHLRPRCYVKGDDWRGRLPQDEQDLCARWGIEIVYLDTVTASSTRILNDYLGKQESQ